MVTLPSIDHFYCSPAQRDGWFQEPVEWWLKLVSVMLAIENTAKRLQQAERPLRADLLTLNKVLVWGINPAPLDKQLIPESALARNAELSSGGADAYVGARIDGMRSRAWLPVMSLLNEWLKVCPTRLYFTYTDARPKVDFSMSFISGDERGCFPALVFDLIGRIRGGTGSLMVLCAHCRNSFSPRREPREGERMFCEDCQDEGWPVRYANRDHYRRNRKEILENRRRQRRKKQ